MVLVKAGRVQARGRGGISLLQCLCARRRQRSRDDGTQC